MAPSIATIALLLCLNLAFFTTVSSTYCPPPPKCPPPKHYTPKHSPPKHSPTPKVPPTPKVSPPTPRVSPPNPRVSPPTVGYPPTPRVSPPTAGYCPRDTLKLGVCANLLNDLVNVVVGTPAKTPCCSLLGGLADLEAAVCLCTAIRANILGINLNVPVSLSLLLNYCGKSVPKDFQCSS